MTCTIEQGHQQPDHPRSVDRGRGEVPPSGERREAGWGHHVRLPGDDVQPATVGVDRYGAVAQPCPHPRRQAPVAVPALARGSVCRCAADACARDVRADVAELVEAGDADQSASRKCESPHPGAGLGKRAGLASCVSRATMAVSPGGVVESSSRPPRPGVLGKKERLRPLTKRARASRWFARARSTYRPRSGVRVARPRGGREVAEC